MASITFESVSKRFDDGTVAVDDFSLAVDDGEFMVLVGPSGSGKTTAMRIVAGLEEATKGTVRIGDRVVNNLAPRDRNVGMIFQNYALYPHMTVAENMGFPLKLAKVGKEERDARVRQTASMLGLEDLMRRKPRQLSGGQRQRVAMGRAIVRDADAFLMDEPLSNLDAKLRVEMRSYIASLHQQVRTTTLYVTHDQSEAMTMGDRVALLRDGRLEQVGVPTELYDRPRNLFVAQFVGSPAMNVISSRLEQNGGGLEAVVGRSRLRLPRHLAERPTVASRVGRAVMLGIRPEDFEDASFAPSRDGHEQLELIVRLVEPMGAEAIVHFDLPAAGRQPEEGPDSQPNVGSLVGRLNRNTAARRDEPLTLAVDTGRLHFFDFDSGDSLGP